MRILSCCWKVWCRTAISKFSWCSCRRRSLLGYLQIDSCLNQTVLTLSRCHQDRAQLWSRSIKSAANPSWRQSILLSWLKQIAKMKEEWDKRGSYPVSIFWCRSVVYSASQGIASVFHPLELRGCRDTTNVHPATSTHPAPCFDALVNEVRERFPGDIPPGALGYVEIPILQHDLPLADNHQGRPTALHAFKDIVLQRLEQTKRQRDANSCQQSLPCFN